MSENTNENRLPPPAFPPGNRKHVHRASNHANSTGGSTAEDAFISPDAPMPERAQQDALQSALISPDDPIPERKIELAEAFRDPEAIEPGEEGQVVGMDLDPHLEIDEVVSGGDPHVMELMAAVGNLAESLKRKGAAGLHTSPDMTRFEATLRAYCVGFLAGRRAEDPPAPEVDEALPSDG